MKGRQKDHGLPPLQKVVHPVQVQVDCVGGSQGSGRGSWDNYDFTPVYIWVPKRQRSKVSGLSRQTHQMNDEQFRQGHFHNTHTHTHTHTQLWHSRQQWHPAGVVPTYVSCVARLLPPLLFLGDVIGCTTLKWRQEGIWLCKTICVCMSCPRH